ncbi:hypothetical protein AB0L63_23275 [Nocardia sp. NPDC051990]
MAQRCWLEPTTYLPDPLEAPDNGQVLICCARPDSDIVLDL